MIVLATIAGLLGLVALHDTVRSPTIRRIALRNLTRRRGEAALVILGSALGTAIIAGALIVGDTFDKSIRDIARTELGPIDQIITVNDRLDLVTARTAVDAVDGVDGVATLSSITAAVTSNGDDHLGEPRATVTEADLDELRSLGRVSTGLTAAGPTPTGSDLVISEDHAETLDVDVGDTVSISAYGTSATFLVRSIVPAIGVGGFGEVFVAPGTFERLGAAASGVGEPPRYQVLVSLDGDVFDSTSQSETTLALIDARLANSRISYELDDIKAELLADAAAEGTELTSIFSAIGGFSVLAGVLLLVNLFVMLAEERKPSLGVLRAVGWRRGHLVRGFTLEGAAYGTIAAVLGSVAGVGVGWLIVAYTRSVFSDTQADFDLVLAIEPRSLIQAGLIGLVISLTVVWLTSWRISRLNVIRAIRDLPEPSSARSRRLAMILSPLGILASGALTIVGYTNELNRVVLVGGASALLCSLPILSRIVGPRAAAICTGATIIAWSIGAFTLFKDLFRDPAIDVFLLQGVQLVLGSVLITNSLGNTWSTLANVIPGGRGPGVRLGLVYPVARRFRTGLSLAMFSLIIFSLTFIAVLSNSFGAKTDDFVAQTSAGADALVVSNAANPVNSAQLVARDSVASAVGVLRAFPDFTADFDSDDAEEWALTGIDSNFISDEVPPLKLRSPDFASDREAFEALVTNPRSIIVPSWFLGDEDAGAPALGSNITVYNRAGEHTDLTVTAVLEEDWIWAGSFASVDLVTAFLPGEYAANRHYVSFADGVDAERAATELEGAFVQNGIEAETFDEIIGRDVREQRGFFSLLSGYLSLGLVIGVAGLGVVMVRGVRERRQQVGMLRAMGMPTSGVRTIFLTEGAFVSMQGVLSGAVLGLMSSYQLLTQADTFDIALDFAIPYRNLAIIMVIPLVASAIASAVPAARAARLPAAEALRLTD